jgi:hypothetical protein
MNSKFEETFITKFEEAFVFNDGKLDLTKTLKIFEY